MFKEQCKNKKLQKRIDNLTKKYKDKKVLLYGAGKFFRETHENLDLTGLNIIGITDQKFISGNNEKMFDINCFSLPETKNLDYDVILTTVLNPSSVENFLKENMCKSNSVIENLVPIKKAKHQPFNFNFLPPKSKPANNDIYAKLKSSELSEKECLLKPYFNEFTISMEDYKNLISNLDSESIIEISRVLNRLKLITHDYSYEYKDLFTKEEIETYRKMHENLYDVIQDFGNGMHAYKNYFLPVSHFEHNVFFFNHNMDGINLDFIKDKDIIDVGAYVGDSALVLSEYTDKNVISFEANPINFGYLQRTLAMNNISNVIPINKGLGAAAGRVKFSNGYSSGSRIVSANDDNLQEAEIITLDEYVQQNNVKCGLIKVDIEGAEPEFLKGAYNTIKEQRPTILLSIYHNANDIKYLKPLVESWNLGYKFRIVSPYNGYVVTETMLICEREEL